MIYLTRSSQVTFSDCRRKGYWSYIYRNGLDPVTPQWPLIMGLVVHKGMEFLIASSRLGPALDMMEKEWDHLVTVEHTPDVKQKWFICEALVRGWARVRLGPFLDEFEVLDIEKEVQAQLAPNLVLQGRADIVVRSKRDGALYVWNWKTTSDMKEWTEKFEDDVQAMTEALLTQEDMKEPVRGGIFEGLYKGSMYKGVSTSPLVTGYRQNGNWSHEGRASAKTEKLSVWDNYPGGLEAWIAALPEDVVAEQFIRSAPVMKNDDEVRDWLRQVVRKWTDIEYMLSPEVEEEERLIFFDQNKGWRCRWCQFRPACKLQMTVDDMLEGGQLKVREDHHGRIQE